MRLVGKQMHGFTLLVLLVAGTALLPVGYPQEEETYM